MNGTHVLENVHEVEREAVRGLRGQQCFVGDKENLPDALTGKAEGGKKEKQKEIKQRKMSRCAWKEEDRMSRRSLVLNGRHEPNWSSGGISTIPGQEVSTEDLGYMGIKAVEKISKRSNGWIL